MATRLRINKIAFAVQSMQYERQLHNIFLANALVHDAREKLDRLHAGSDQAGNAAEVAQAEAELLAAKEESRAAVNSAKTTKLVQSHQTDPTAAHLRTLSDFMFYSNMAQSAGMLDLGVVCCLPLIGHLFDTCSNRRYNHTLTLKDISLYALYLCVLSCA